MFKIIEQYDIIYICIIRITNTYFSPAELKNLNITTSRGPTAYVAHCHSAGQTVALVANRPNCNCHIHIQLWLVMDTHYGHNALPNSSANYRVANRQNCNCLISIQSAC